MNGLCRHFSTLSCRGSKEQPRLFRQLYYGYPQHIQERRLFKSMQVGMIAGSAMGTWSGLSEPVDTVSWTLIGGSLGGIAGAVCGPLVFLAMPVIVPTVATRALYEHYAGAQNPSATRTFDKA